MLRLVRTNSDNDDFRSLVKELDADLSVRDGDDHAFYHQYNAIDAIKYTVVVYDGGKPVGSGAIKFFDDESMEVKRMFVIPASRGKGIATGILSELEKWAREMGNKRCLLETGKKQPEAIALYQKNGYSVIPNFGQYQGIENSICFEKII